MLSPFVQTSLLVLPTLWGRFIIHNHKKREARLRVVKCIPRGHTWRKRWSLDLNQSPCVCDSTMCSSALSKLPFSSPDVLLGSRGRAPMALDSNCRKSTWSPIYTWHPLSFLFSWLGCENMQVHMHNTLIDTHTPGTPGWQEELVSFWDSAERPPFLS
jgi:hypothetical protein